MGLNEGDATRGMDSDGMEVQRGERRERTRRIWGVGLGPGGRRPKQPGKRAVVCQKVHISTLALFIYTSC
jgi:hypothetical protein